MKQYFSIQPYTGLGKSGYRAKFVNRSDRQGRSLGDIAEAAAEKGGDAKSLTYAFERVMDESIAGALETGEIQHLGSYGSLMLNIHGTFAGVDDRFDPARHSLDFRFVPGRALKGLTPQFALENIVSSASFAVNEIGPVGETAPHYGESRYMVRGHQTAINVKNGLMSARDSVCWEVVTSDSPIVTGDFTVLENDAARMVLNWPAGIPAALRKDELTLVFTMHGPLPDGAPQIKRVTVPLYAD